MMALRQAPIHRAITTSDPERYAPKTVWSEDAPATIGCARHALTATGKALHLSKVWDPFGA